MRIVMTMVIVAVLGTNVAQGQPQPRNEIGIYTVPDPSLANIPNECRYDGPPGNVRLYIVLTNPFNEKTGLPITRVGGYEFGLELTGGMVTFNDHQGPNSYNFLASGDYSCSANLPVIDGKVVLIEIGVGTFDATPFVIYLSPVSRVAAQSFPGGIAIADADDNYHLEQAYPMSGDLALPVFGFWTGVVDGEDESWGRLKALYR